MRAFVVGIGFVAACGGSQLELYEVSRVKTADCEIRANGEFCEEVVAQTPVIENFAVEHDGTVTIVYFGEEAWIAPGLEGPRTSVKDQRVTAEPGPCTSVTLRSLDFDVIGELFEGSLNEVTRIEGADVCGETPRGRRQSFVLSGIRTNAI